jgi:tRNA pseudouridine55 synthase
MKSNLINGVVLLDKPEGLSSNTAMQIVKRLFKADKAGHAGTLDPMATGMLPICLGQATKLAEYLLDEDKCYQAVIQLGQATSTGDKEGEIIAEANIPDLNTAIIESALVPFRGSISQTPPMYSALKHQGQPLYKLARQGIEIERKVRQVTIYELKLVSFTENTLTIIAKVSKGTYIRTLGEDIAKALGTIGHLIALRRLYSGGFNPERMQSLEALKALDQSALHQQLQPMESLLLNWPSVDITRDQWRDLMHGKSVHLASTLSGQARLLCDHKLIAIAELNNGLIFDRKILQPDYTA